LRVPVLPDEEETIKANARRAGLTVAEYLRRLALGHEIRGTVDQQGILDLAKINADQGRLGGLLKLWLTDDRKLKEAGAAWSAGTVRALLGRLESTQAALLEAAKKL
jgi:hypothetical protein